MELYLACKQRQLHGPVNHRGFRETGPWPSCQPSRSVFPKKDTPPLQPHPQGREGSFWIIAKKEVHRRWLLYFCRPWLVSLAFAYPKFVIMMHNVALTQTTVLCLLREWGSDTWRLCELHMYRLWANVLWFCLTISDCSPQETKEITPAASTTKCLDYRDCKTWYVCENN